MNSCRHKGFGVELYESCNIPKHPPIKWKSCRNEVFGIEKPKSFEIIMTNKELYDFVLVTNSGIDPYSKLLAYSKANYVSMESNRNEYSCLIKNTTINQNSIL